MIDWFHDSEAAVKVEASPVPIEQARAKLKMVLGLLEAIQAQIKTAQAEFEADIAKLGDERSAPDDGNAYPPRVLDAARILDSVLPEGLSPWELIIPGAEGKTLAHEAAKRGRLPPGFDRWELATVFGRTVAHVAAERGPLPRGFDRWAARDKFGRTVAHVAARVGGLPEDFDGWDWADYEGRTVAYEAAWTGNLPEGFDQHSAIRFCPPCKED